MRVPKNVGPSHSPKAPSAKPPKDTSSPKALQASGPGPSRHASHSLDHFQPDSKGQKEVKGKSKPEPGAGKARASGADASSSDFRENDRMNTVANEQLRHGKWKTTTPVLKQTQPTNCGPASVAMLASSKGEKALAGKEKGPAGKEKDLTGAQKYMDKLEAKYTDGKSGTTSEQMGQMLSDAKLKVTLGAGHLDQAALDKALQKGQKAVAMVDSNLIRPGGGRGAGASHWVVIDGKDKQGEYLVKNPATGSSYYLGAQQLSNAMSTSKDRYDGGGMLVVEAAGHAKEGGTSKYTGELGSGPGIGSPGAGFGREAGN